MFVLWVVLLKTVNCWRFYVVFGSIVVADAQLPDQGISINKSGSSLLFQSILMNMVTFNLNTFWSNNPFKKNLLSHLSVNANPKLSNCFCYFSRNYLKLFFKRLNYDTYLLHFV